MPRLPFKLINLTHILTQESPSWEGDCGFKQKCLLDYSECANEVKFNVQMITMNAGIGTHIDAPAHCIPGGKTIDMLHIDDLAAPCVVIDVSSQMDASFLLSVRDIHNFEHEWGKIQNGSFVIVHTGWSQFWNEPDKYRNDLRFPSISLEAATLLLQRQIVGLGIDTLSPDTANSHYPVHQAILGAGKYLVENIAHADALPPTGAYTLAMPLLTKGGTEAPIRLLGLILPDCGL